MVVIALLLGVFPLLVALTFCTFSKDGIYFFLLFVLPIALVLLLVSSALTFCVYQYNDSHSGSAPAVRVTRM